MKTSDSLHPGISVHHIQVGGGVAGSLVAIVSMLIFLVGVPALRYFLVGAIAIGSGIAIALRLVHQHNSRPLPKILG